MQRLLVFSCLVAFALASYADESCVDTAHPFPTYGADAHLNCWVPQKDANGNPLPPHTICLRISQFATCDTNCKLELNPDPDVGDSATVWRCSSALTYCNQWLEKGSGYDTKVHPLELAQPGKSGNKMRNAIPISCIKRGVCDCEEKKVNNQWVQVCKKGSDLDNGDLYQGIEGGAACSVPADPNNPVVPPAGDGSGADPGAGGGDPNVGVGSDPDTGGGDDSSYDDGYEDGSFDDGSYDDCGCSDNGCV